MLLLSIILFFASPQPKTNEKEIMQPIRDLFRGMEEVDSAVVRNAFTENPHMFTVQKTPEGTKLVKGDFNRFLDFIGTPREQLVAEPIWDVKIQQDGDLAQVWATYALYVGGKMNHCGSDAFELIRQDGAWKIFFIADTRHKTGCKVPDSVKEKYEK